jgi:hypothetical protein
MVVEVLLVVGRGPTSGSEPVLPVTAMKTIRDERGSIIGILIPAILIVLVIVGPLVLHFSQRRHNVLPFDVKVAYPDDAQIVGGEVYASALAAIMEHELSGIGWRPNDFILWGPTLWADNNANRQLGIILAVRESTRAFKDHMTKVSSNQYDPNLMTAETFFRNDEYKFWFPAAETRYREGVAALRKYVAGLRTTPPSSSPLNRRNVELIRLFQSWADMLGDAHAMLFKSHEPDGSAVALWHTDDYFYHAQGVAHVLHHLTLALIREYAIDLQGRPTVATLLNEVAATLGEAAVTKPLIVLDGGSAGILANHRRNLGGYIVEARQKIYTVREELEK